MLHWCSQTATGFRVANNKHYMSDVLNSALRDLWNLVSHYNPIVQDLAKEQNTAFIYPSWKTKLDY
jgi:hypothetical protein